MLAMFAVLRWFIPREEISRDLDREGIRSELRQLGPFSRGEKFAACTLLVTLFCWILPDIAPLFLGPRHPASVWLLQRFNWAVVALLIPTALFVLPIDWKARKFAMTWDEAVRNIEWGTMALVAGALAMGEMVANREFGLGAFFASSISSVAGPETSRYVFLLVAITLAVALTNLATNVAVISIMGPIALTVAPDLGLNPIALVTVLSVASCIGYSTPMANPPCAIVFASGYIRILPMFQRGLILSGLGIILLSLVGYPVADRLMPWEHP
jgi:sodium-dependent dicarboxylate transporter 2/3/5